MNKFTKKDFLFSLMTGFYTGVIVWQILNFLEAPSFGLPTDHPHALFVVIVPVLWIFGVNLGYFLGRWMAFFNQFGKFAAIGFTNTAVDFAILNFLIAFTGTASGWGYVAFKAISFMVSAIHSYGWNRIWVFESVAQDKRAEFIKFFTVAIFAILVNVGVASFIVNFIDPLFGLEDNLWANIGAIAGSAAALLFGFVGLKLIVFKKSSSSETNKNPVI